MDGEFVAAARAMLLPVSAGSESAYLQFISDRLENAGVPPADQATWINVELRRWRDTAAPSPELRALVRSALYDPARDPVSFMFDEAEVGDGWGTIADSLSRGYFSAHASLIASGVLDHDAARQLLSHAGMIARLAVHERMTASEISRLVAARDQRFQRNWAFIDTILTRMGCKPELSLEEFQTTARLDGENEAALFGDLDIPGSIARVAQLATDLGCPGNFQDWLTDLLIEDRHDPFLLILHYQLIIQAHFDHAVTYAYEFEPRGEKAAWLTQQYVVAGIPVALSAFLNNAKATLRFDGSWVAGRSRSPRGAAAVSQILIQLESLGALAKAELAAHLRALIRRHIRLQTEQHGQLPNALPALTAGQLAQLLAHVSNGNSNTTGIVEQRLVDCLATARHGSEAGWSERGVGDSVFAPNVGRRKLGDCEFMQARENPPRIVAYEAHGGRLSAPYVTDHLASFARTLRVRVEELEAIAPLGDWQIEVEFIAHSFTPNLPGNAQIEVGDVQVDVALRYTSFEAALGELGSIQAVDDLIDRLFTGPLNSPFVHPAVRERVLEISQ